MCQMKRGVGWCSCVWLLISASVVTDINVQAASYVAPAISNSTGFTMSDDKSDLTAARHGSPVAARAILATTHQQMPPPFWRGRQQTSPPPCRLHPLCTCTGSGGDDLGVVHCSGSRLTRMPDFVGHVKMFALTLEDNDLQQLDNEPSLERSRLWKLAIINNGLREVPDKIFHGLQRSLRQMSLRNNRLVRVPHSAIGDLQFLIELDLSGNAISTISRLDFNGFESSLEVLNLNNNQLSSMDSDVVSGLTQLHTLHLANNRISLLHPHALVNAPQLSYLDLSGNLLQAMPISMVANSAVKWLVLASNLIENITSDPQESNSNRVSLRYLDLSYNSIRYTNQDMGKYYSEIERLRLTGNRLRFIDGTLFSSLSIQELFMDFCSIEQLTNTTFDGLSKSLTHLDLSGNQLKDLPWNSLSKLSQLGSLSLDNNHDLKVNHSDLMKLRYLKTISLKRVLLSSFNISTPRGSLENAYVSVRDTGALSQRMMSGMGEKLRSVKFPYCDLTSVAGNAFHNCPTLKHLDLSYNSITSFGPGVMVKLSSSLESLTVNEGFSGPIFPHEAVSELISLQKLDFSRNSITSIDPSSFVKMKNIKYVNFRYNKIASLSPDTFSPTYNPYITAIDVSFNNLKALEEGLFYGLRQLETLYLSENEISSLSSGVFISLLSLTTIRFDNNKISKLPDKVFRNIPRLRHISFSHNRLTGINMDAFDQVGILQSLHMDFSYNKIETLKPDDLWYSYFAIDSINLSHNMIKMISSTFFESMRETLVIIDLSHNHIANVTRDVFSRMPYLQLLDISHNNVSKISELVFQDCPNLRVLNLSQNVISSLPDSFFGSHSSLESLDLSRNVLHNLPANLLRSTSVQRLILHSNRLAEVPVSALSRVTDSLRALDLSNNIINELSDDSLHHVPQLRRLNVANNSLASLQSDTLRSLTHLILLDVSNNPLDDVTLKLALHHVPSVLHLQLSNCSLMQFPDISTSSVSTIDVSFNSIGTLTASMFFNLSRLQELNLSHNRLKRLDPSIGSMLQSLLSFNVAENPLQNISEDAFAGLKKLQQLDISGVSLSSFKSTSLSQLPSLRSLALTVFDKTPKSRMRSRQANTTDISSHNLATLVSFSRGLASLHLTLNASLTDQLRGNMSTHLCSFTLTGPGSARVSASALQDVRCARASVHVRGAGVTVDDGFLAGTSGGRVHVLRVDDGARVGRPSPPQQHDALSRLLQLQVHGRHFECSCRQHSLGWVMEWLRPWMSTHCALDRFIDHHEDDYHHQLQQQQQEQLCQQLLGQLRVASCQSGQSLISGLRQLHCSSGSHISHLPLVTTLVLTFVLNLWRDGLR